MTGAYNLQAFARQSHRKLGIVFGVADARDDALPVAQRSCRQHPALETRISIGETSCHNRKVALLAHMSRFSHGEWVVVSYSNVRVSGAYVQDITCVVTDADCNRVWAPLDPTRTRIRYAAPSTSCNSCRGDSGSDGAVRSRASAGPPTPGVRATRCAPPERRRESVPRETERGRGPIARSPGDARRVRSGPRPYATGG